MSTWDNWDDYANRLYASGISPRLIAEMSNRDNWRTKSNSRGRGSSTWPIKVMIKGDSGITQRWEREQDKKAVSQFNRNVRAWGKMVNAQLLSSISRHIDKDVNLSKSLKQNYWHFGKPIREGQEITSIGFSFAPEGIYVHLGVGRGYAMEGGTRIITKKINREDLRPPKDWFNPIIAQNINSLGEIVKNYCRDLYLAATHIYINR